MNYTSAPNGTVTELLGFLFSHRNYVDFYGIFLYINFSCIPSILLVYLWSSILISFFFGEPKIYKSLTIWGRRIQFMKALVNSLSSEHYWRQDFFSNLYWLFPTTHNRTYHVFSWHAFRLLFERLTFQFTHCGSFYKNYDKFSVAFSY